MRRKTVGQNAVRFLAVALLLMGGFCLDMPQQAQAEEAELAPELITVEMPEDYPDNDELFAGYVEQAFYGKWGTYGTGAREGLSDIGKAMYDYLKEECAKVANGEIQSTEFTLDASGIPLWNTAGYELSWTAEELGVDAIVVDGNATEAAISAAQAKVVEELDAVYYALQYDCPYEMYWRGGAFSRGIRQYIPAEDSFTVVSAVLNIVVSVDYAPENAESQFVTDGAKTSVTIEAVDYAKGIVSEFADLTDYDKIIAYGERIMELTSYNDEAAASNDYPYGDPWQMIWVFDNDDTTNVVCEGYAKAFQYLCDMSEFHSDTLECYTVSGFLGGGGHRWNVVKMDDGKNYIVDLTNSDEGTVGYSGGLFLSGMTGSVEDGYTSSATSSLFTYREETLSLYGTGENSILTMATEDYEPLFQVANKSLTLYNNLSVKFKVPDTLFEDGTYTNPTLVIDFGGFETTLSSYAHEGDRYVFEFDSIAPHMMTDTITYTLKATHDGTEYAAETDYYSIATYCYNMLGKYPTDAAYASLRTLLVDLLNYGTAAQTYMNYNISDLANAQLTEQQIACGTSSAPSLTTVKNMAHATIASPSVTWTSGGLRLEDAIIIRLKFQAESTDGLSVKFVRESDSSTWTISSFESNGDGTYYVYFPGLNVAQLRDVVDATVYKNGVAVSDTFRYSIESYAYAKTTDGSADAALQELLLTMMKYGDSAYSFAN